MSVAPYLQAAQPEPFPEARSATDRSQNIFDVRDIGALNTDPLLSTALESKIRHCWVQFLLTNEVKPHVVFKFNFREGFLIEGLSTTSRARHRSPGRSREPPRSQTSASAPRPFISYLISIDVGDAIEGDSGPGACVIKVCSYAGRTGITRAAFQFRVYGD